MLGPTFELQGHRGARGLKPENTLPGFEIALDVGVSAIETDLHMTHDGVPVLAHDPVIDGSRYRLIRGPHAVSPEIPARIDSLDLAQLRGYRADVNPDPTLFPHQNGACTPLASWFASSRGIDPYTPPTLQELFLFARTYAASKPGKDAQRTPWQRHRAKHMRFDLEIKREPFRHSGGEDLGKREDRTFLERVVKLVREARVLERTTVRSFDHRTVRSIKMLEPQLTGAVLVAGTAPVEPAELAQRADASIYCPEFTFLDEEQVRQCHDAGIRVIPWTVNDRPDWERLLDWGVDGITTDYPDRLAQLLRERGIPF